MSPRTVDFWFDYTCPYAYLGSVEVEAMCARMGAALRWRPMLLGGVFRANKTPQKLFAELSPAKAAHNAEDLQRWAARFNATLTMPAAHPMRSVEALRATLAAGCDPRVIHGFYRAYWVEGREVSSPEVIREVLTAAGFDADAILPTLAGDALRDELRARTDEAIALGVFGAPAFVCDGELQWGQDRMHLVEGLSLAQWIATAHTDRPSVPHTLDVYFDFSSPFAYLGATQAEALAARTGATLRWRPILLGGLFRALGQADAPLLTFSDAKRDWVLRDLQRWAKFYGVPLKFPSVFPQRSLKALRCYLALPEARRGAFREAAFRAAWADDRDLDDDALLRELLGDDHGEIRAAADSPEVKAALREGTEAALRAGVFGVPTWVVDERALFWGQDRLLLVEHALREETDESAT